MAEAAEDVDAGLSPRTCFGTIFAVMGPIGAAGNWARNAASCIRLSMSLPRVTSQIIRGRGDGEVEMR